MTTICTVALDSWPTAAVCGDDCTAVTLNDTMQIVEYGEREEKGGEERRDSLLSSGLYCCPVVKVMCHGDIVLVLIRVICGSRQHLRGLSGMLMTSFPEK